MWKFWLCKTQDEEIWSEDLLSKQTEFACIYADDSLPRYNIKSSFKIRYDFSSKLVLTHLPAHRNVDIQDQSLCCFQAVLSTDLAWMTFIQASSQPSAWPQICIFLCNLLGQEALTFPMNLASSAKSSLISLGSHVALKSSCLYQVWICANGWLREK